MMNKKNSIHLKILSYNIHKGFNLGKTQYTLDLIKKGVKESGAELICLQEVCGPSSLTLNKEKTHPLHTQFEFLADGIWPHYAYGKNAVYKKGDHGNAILSKYPIIETHNLNLTTNRFEKRGLLHAKIEIPNGPHVHILTAHLDLLEKGRQNQCQKIIDYIHKNIREEEHLILAGDFNDWREKLSKRYWNEGKLQEVFLQQFNKHAKTFPSIAPTLRLDRIYFRNLVTQKALCFSGEPWNKISDHSPLYAEFSI